MNCFECISNAKCFRTGVRVGLMQRRATTSEDFFAVAICLRLQSGAIDRSIDLEIETAGGSAGSNISLVTSTESYLLHSVL